MKLPRLLIAGTHSGVGKTTMTLALLAGFRAQERRVQPFKVGPDFIDPGHQQLASGRASHNLDGWMLGACVNRMSFQNAAQDADPYIIEGMMGLFHGSLPINGIGSGAEMAKQLNASVLLVVDGECDGEIGGGDGARAAPDWKESVVREPPKSSEPLEASLTIAVAYDPAFCFYYPEDLALLCEQVDASLVSRS